MPKTPIEQQVQEIKRNAIHGAMRHLLNDPAYMQRVMDQAINGLRHGERATVLTLVPPEHPFWDVMRKAVAKALRR